MTFAETHGANGVLPRTAGRSLGVTSIEDGEARGRGRSSRECLNDPSVHHSPAIGGTGRLFCARWLCGVFGISPEKDTLDERNIKSTPTVLCYRQYQQQR
jgi:hypothetical protein